MDPRKTETTGGRSRMDPRKTETTGGRSRMDPRLEYNQQMFYS
jgi:hypothetical protein